MLDVKSSMFSKQKQFFYTTKKKESSSSMKRTMWSVVVGFKLNCILWVKQDTAILEEVCECKVLYKDGIGSQAVCGFYKCECLQTVKITLLLIMQQKES